MADFSKMVRALRCKGMSKECDSCGYGYHISPDSECNDACDVERFIADAADAIEALQAEVDALKHDIERYVEINVELTTETEALQAEVEILKVSGREAYFEGLAADKEPKRGEWILHPDVQNAYGGEIIECPFCGEKYIVQYVSDEKFCRNCGADMRKMEVQDG